MKRKAKHQIKKCTSRSIANFVICLRILFSSYILFIGVLYGTGMGNHNSSTIINSNQVKSRNSINYYSVEFLQHDNAYSTSAANFAHTLSSFNQEAFLNEVIFIIYYLHENS